MKKKYCFGIIFLLFFVLFSFPAAADEQTVLPQEYGKMLEDLPDSLQDTLPEEVFTNDPTALEKLLKALLTPRTFLRAITDTVSEHATSYLKLFLRLVGILLLRAVWNTWVGNFHSSPLCDGINLISRAVIALSILSESMRLFDGITAFFSDLGALTQAYLPLMSAMYAMGGNISTAVVNESTMILAMSLIDIFGGKSVLSLTGVCLSLALLGVFDTSLTARTKILTGKIKKWYTTVMSLVMLILTALLAAQNTLHAKADSLTFKTVRFAVSSSIPVVGGSVAEMLRTAGAGLEWMRGIVGLGGILLLLWLLLPTLLSVLFTRWTVSLAGDIAAFLGCDHESALLGEISSIFGYLLAVIAVSALTFFFSLLLLLHCATAYSV